MSHICDSKDFESPSHCAFFSLYLIEYFLHASQIEVLLNTTSKANQFLYQLFKRSFTNAFHFRSFISSRLHRIRQLSLDRQSHNFLVTLLQSTPSFNLLTKLDGWPLVGDCKQELLVWKTINLG